MNKWRVRLLINFLEKFEIDESVISVWIYKLIVIVGGLITAIIILQKFTPDLQGFYYTFLSLIALQIFAEMGCTVIIVSVASHEWAHLKINKIGLVSGNIISLERLSSLTKLSMTWFGVGSLFFFNLMLFGGYYFFQNSYSNQQEIWLNPWIALSLVSTANLILLPIFSILEGCNQIFKIYRFKLIASAVANLATWVGILYGANLWVVSISQLTYFCLSIFFLNKNYSGFLKQVLLKPRSRNKIHWKKEIYPMQWRISLSWISGYLTYSLFVPVLFYFQGAKIAGAMGITWQLIQGLSNITSSWTTAKMPNFGMLISQRKYKELDRIFYKVVSGAAFLTVLGAFTIYGAISFIHIMNLSWQEKLLTPMVTGIFLVATVLQMFTLPFSTYLRAHKKEPLFYVSILSGMLVSITTVLTAFFLNITYVALGYLVVTVLVTPMTVYIWYKLKREWHLDCE